MFTDGQHIGHTIGINKTLIDIYDTWKNVKIKKSLSGFAESHNSIDRTYKLKSTNGWKECECKINGKWISIFNL
jgi:hypothetical protein